MTRGTALYLHPFGGVLTAVATDGHRLSCKTLPNVQWSGDAGAIVPDTAVVTLLSLLKSKDGASVRVSLWERGARFIHADWQLDTRTVQGTYPDYRRVIPTAAAQDVLLAPKTLTATLKSMLSGAGRANPCVVIDTAAAELVMRYQDQDYTAALPGRGHPDTPKVGIAGRYLQDMADAFAALGVDVVTLHVSDETSAVRVTATGSDAFMVIMPVRA